VSGGDVSTEGTISVDDLNDLFENAPCGYLLASKDGRITRANRTLSAWIGFEPEALAKLRFSDLLTIGGRLFYETHFAPMLHMQGSFSEVALDLKCADGTSLPVLVNAVERSAEGDRAGFIRIMIFRASERRRYERNLLDAKVSAEKASLDGREASELRDQFIAVLGHDLRNPLAAIASGTHLLSREQLSDQGQTILAMVDGSVSRASALINDVLDFARGRLGGGITLSRGIAQPLEPIIRQVVGEIRAIAPDRVIEADINAMEPVDADGSRIGQLASNLLGNAITHGAADAPVRLSATIGGGLFELSVSNGGTPISPEAMAHLFRPFFRGAVRPNQQGLGLGLHIASEIAKAHGGILTVLSTEAETRFTFQMPLE
jgi:sigma-B regulation protein RsbU (phosphoserine phosphatase)